MASRSADLALKAAVVAALVAMLVVPSLGRCRSAPPPPAPTPPPPLPPAPAPAPGPMTCNRCVNMQCYWTCVDDIPKKCVVPCESVCNRCKTSAMESCMSGCGGTCSCNGTCTEEWCRSNIDFSQRCYSECSSRNCYACRNNAEGKCRESCTEYCDDATNCIKP